MNVFEYEDVEEWPEEVLTCADLKHSWFWDGTYEAQTYTVGSKEDEPKRVALLRMLTCKVCKKQRHDAYDSENFLRISGPRYSGGTKMVRPLGIQRPGGMEIRREHFRRHTD